MQKWDSVAMHRVRRLLAELGSKQGRGTELISLYIPPKKPLYDVINNLREEAGTASNIKSDTTRNHVLDALTRVTQRLKLYKTVPENGLVIFCGALPVSGPNTETIQIFEIVPPRPINTYLYRCDDHFHLDLLRQTLREEETIGILSIDTAEAALGRLVGDAIQVVEVLTSGIAGKHRQGGQSARRFERLRENEINDFFTRVATHANKTFIDETPVQKLIVGGPGPTKDIFYKGNYLDYRLQKAVIAVIDTSYTGEEGIREIVQRATPILQDVRLVQEDNLVDKFIAEASKEYGLAVYGLNNVIDALNNNSAGTIIISEQLDLWYLLFRCRKCGNTVEKFVKREDIFATQTQQSDTQCKVCGSKDWDMQQQDIVDFISDKALATGAQVEVISGKTEHGQMFNSFGGIGALLRYRPKNPNS
ncbi:MAG: peptide chain release factor aRF-1 [Nitrososphaerota archaeon]